jgi:carbon-monoxide dehydrogenase iron sulfur subunit
MNKQIYVAIEKCLGCRSCELACAVAHSQTKELMQAIQEASRPQARVEVGMVETFAVPLHCRHCEDAPCITVCPSHAMSRSGPNEPVICQSSKCIGCTLCILVCPFGVLKMDRAGKAIVKCDLCQELLAEGRDPACVTACPTGAIRFISITQFSEIVADRARAEMVAALKAGDKVRTVGR